MNSHNHPDDLLDLSLRHTLKNWTARQTPPPDTREKLLIAALRQGKRTSRKKSTRFHFGGWSFRLDNELNESTVRVIYRYKLETVFAMKAMGMA